MTATPSHVFSIKLQADNCESAVHRFAQEAMATTFELMAAGGDFEYVHQVAVAAFNEVNQLEQQLSRFIETSDISRINTLGASQSVPVGPAAFECLLMAEDMRCQTGGAFDITAVNTEGKQPVNGSGLRIDRNLHTVCALNESTQICLGGIGKGYAIDRAMKIVADFELDAALMHAGQSSIIAVGTPAGLNGWPIVFGDPQIPGKAIFELAVCEMALSGSGIFQHGHHIVNPHIGEPVAHRIAAWSHATSATEADALSTAFMVMSEEQVKQYCQDHPGIGAMLMMPGCKGNCVKRFGKWPTIETG